MKQSLAYAEKKLTLSGCFQNFVCAAEKGQKKWFLEAKDWFNEEESEWIFCFETVRDYRLG